MEKLVFTIEEMQERQDSAVVQVDIENVNVSK